MRLFIWIGLYKVKNSGTFVLDKKLLLHNIFFLNVGWKINPDGEKYYGSNFDERTLDHLLTKFNGKINYQLRKKEIPKKYKNTIINLSNEILVSKKISLKKYLLQININPSYKKAIKYIEKYYPGIKIQSKDPKMII